MITAEQIYKRVEELEKMNLITARFGDNWREHQKRMLDEGQITIDMLLDIAWKQGRKVIMLECAIEELTAR